MEKARSGVREGGCACGNVRYRCIGDPMLVSYCHCADCRRHTGAPVTIFAGFARDGVLWTGRLSRRRTSTHVHRGFCPDCGVQLTYEDDLLQEELYLLAGTLDDPSSVRPRWHAWTSEALAYLDIADGLPRYPGFSRPRDA